MKKDLKNDEKVVLTDREGQYFLIDYVVDESEGTKLEKLVARDLSGELSDLESTDLFKLMSEIHEKSDELDKDDIVGFTPRLSDMIKNQSLSELKSQFLNILYQKSNYYKTLSTDEVVVPDESTRTTYDHVAKVLIKLVEELNA